MDKFTAIILAGGYGSRLNGFRNPYKCKPLIRGNDGNFLLHHTLRELVKSNCIRDLLVTSRIELHQIIEEELKSFDIPFRIHYVTGNERVREVLASLMAYVENSPFFVICGHAPPTHSHISKMGKSVSENGGQAISCFRESKKHMSIRICNQTNKILDFFYVSATDRGSDFVTYQIDSPLLVNKDTVLGVKREEYMYWYDRYLMQDIADGKRVSGFIADFPAEADTVDEIKEAINHVSVLT